MHHYRRIATGGRLFFAFTLAWIAADAIAGPDQQLTDCARRIQAKHPIIWHAAVLATACHLLNYYQALGVPGLDPYTRTSSLTGHALRRAGLIVDEPC